MSASTTTLEFSPEQFTFQRGVLVFNGAGVRVPFLNKLFLLLQLLGELRIVSQGCHSGYNMTV